jgi:PAS domain S-box-containing protein
VLKKREPYKATESQQKPSSMKKENLTYNELEKKVQLNEFRLNALIELSGMVNSSEKELYDFVLEKAVEYSESQVGFLGFVNDDQENVSIYSWSKTAMKQCEIQVKPIVFNIASSGVWAEPIREKEPLIINDFSAPNPLKNGLPKGHLKILNYAGIPHFDNNKVVALLAVGNKNGKYDSSDIRQLELFMDGMWKILKQRRTETILIQQKQELENKNKKIQHLYQAAKSVLHEKDFETVAKILFESCKQLTGATSGYVALLNEKGEENELLFLDAGGMPCSVDENLPMPIRGLRGIAYKQSKAVYDNDFMNSDHIQYMPGGHVSLKNVLFAPLFINKKAAGLIGLANKPTDFNNKDLEIISTFGELASIALNNSRSYDELINAKEKAEESEKQLKKSQRTGKIGNWIWYIKENRLWWSDEMSRIFDIDKKEFTGKLDEVINKAIHPDDKQKVYESNSSVISQNKPIPVEYRIIRPDGSIKYVLGKADDMVLDENGKSQLLTGIVKDITEYKLIETELIKSKEKAELSDRLKTAFLQNISHEIRTPLNAISGFSGMLNKPKLSGEKRNSFTSIIQTSSNQLLSIVSDILTLSSLETKQEKINTEEVCINNIIVDLLSIFKQQSLNRNISLYAKKPLNDYQSEIYTDKTKITQILSNLISNALKFTHEGFIEFGYNLKNNELEFYVKDSGIGIKPEQQEEIFERFRQADLSINKKYGGTGLGLSISKGFAELLGGKIWVNSEPDNGSSFYFTIPYRTVNQPDTTTAIKQKNHKQTIIVAEDEEFNFLYIEELLIDFDYHLIHAKDGKESVEIAKNQDVSLILMDIKMPTMDGHTAAKLIKELKPYLPIVAQSAYALEHEIEKYSGIFDDYLAKPIDEDVLIEKVNKYMINE